MPVFFIISSKELFNSDKKNEKNEKNLKSRADYLFNWLSFEIKKSFLIDKQKMNWIISQNTAFFEKAKNGAFDLNLICSVFWPFE